MSWLKNADFPKDVPGLTQELLDGLVAEHETVKDLSEETSHARCSTCALIERAESILGQVKESTILDFPSYNRDDENKGESGCFDENAPVDMKKKIAPDPGPASVNPGQPGANAPQIFQ